MTWTQLSELGVGGRLLASGFIGFTLTAVFMVLALLGVTAFRSPMLSIALSFPLLPGLGIAALLNITHGGVEELASALYFNGGVYTVLVFGIWQRRVSKRLRRESSSVTVSRPGKGD